MEDKAVSGLSDSVSGNQVPESETGPNCELKQAQFDNRDNFVELNELRGPTRHQSIETSHSGVDGKPESSLSQQNLVNQQAPESESGPNCELKATQTDAQDISEELKELGGLTRCQGPELNPSGEGEK